MTGKDPARAAARWRGLLISVALHGLVAGLIVLAARTATHAPAGADLVDNLSPDRDITLTVWDEPVRVVGPKAIKPILVDPPAATTAADVLPPLLPVPPPPPVPAVAQAPKVAADPDVRPAAHNPPLPKPVATVPAGPGGPASASRGSPSQLPVSATAKSIVFVLDRSASMGVDDRLAVARREILACLSQLPAGTRFQVVAYNRAAEALTLNGRRDLVPLSPQTLSELAATLADLTPEGGNDHLPALRQAMWLEPEAVCLLTDADDLTTDMVRIVTGLNRGKNVIHAVTIGSAPRIAMQTLAAHNRGVCRAIEK